jgi:acyl-CoA synthetase (AMP-forming)/AMP-acid ligase II
MIRARTSRSTWRDLAGPDSASEADNARRHLGANKYPRQITIVPAIPLTSVGKLDRKKLRQWVSDAASVQAGS